MIWPPGTRITCFGATEALGLASGEAGGEPGDVDAEPDGFGEPDALVEGDTLGLAELGVEAGLVVGPVLGAFDAVWLPSWPAVWVAVGLTLGWPDDGATVAALVLPPLAATLSDDDAAAAEFWLICADTPCGETRRGVEPATSWPTRLTAVRVTAVTRAHDITHPMAKVIGRVDQFRLRIRLRIRPGIVSCSGTLLVSALVPRD